MRLTLNDVREEDRGAISPCGIICLGCDVHTNESFEAARRIISIWEGFNLADVAIIAGLDTQEVLTVISILKKFAELREKGGSCKGCYSGVGPSAICGIARCVKSKGFWTCAECEDYDTQSDRPCPHSDDADPMPIASRGEMSAIICKRYCKNTQENLKKCREKGYPAFLDEVKERVGKGWRTWQVISNEMLFTKKKES